LLTFRRGQPRWLRGITARHPFRVNRRSRRDASLCACHHSEEHGDERRGAAMLTPPRT